MRYGDVILDSLEPALEAARRAIRRLDATEIPASLARVAAYGGGRLPPPLARSLLDAIDGDEWLRNKAAAEWDGDAATAPGAFLLRPEAWWQTVALEVAVRAERSTAEEVAAGRRAVDKLERKLAATRKRLEEAERAGPAPATDTAELRTRLKAEKRRAAGAAAESAASISGLEEELAVARAEAEEAAAQRDRARREARAVRAELGRATARRRPLGPFPDEPLDLARFLDRLARHGRVVRPAEVPEAPAGEAFVLPAGIVPDERAAVDWVLTWPEPVTFIVDGYNAAAALGEDVGGSRGRERLDHDLARLRRAAAPCRMVVVYDSGLAGERMPRPGPGGIEVRFAPEAASADEEIVAEAAVAAPPVVVVSSDRAVREAAERTGALALWSEALVGWIRG